MDGQVSQLCLLASSVKPVPRLYEFDFCREGRNLDCPYMALHKPFSVLVLISLCSSTPIRIVDICVDDACLNMSARLV